MNILLTGGTGLIGKELGKQLVLEGHKIRVLSRGGEKVKSSVPYPCEIIAGDLNQGPVEIPDVKSIEAVIHLAGESVQGRWNNEKKDAIWHSRVDGTRNLIESLTGATRLKTFVSASGVSFYGDRGDDELLEENGPGEGFLATVSKNWEEAVLGGKDLLPEVRFVCLRTAMVLSREGGALGAMLPIFENHLGAPLGSGQQWMSWIHLHDLVAIYKFVLKTDSLSGPVNAVSPQPVRNSDFTKILAMSLGQRYLPLKVPDVALEIALGEMKEMVLASNRAQPDRLLGAGFEFEYRDLSGALGHLLACRREGDSELWHEQFIAAPLADVFEFFSSEKNLERITPPFLKFRVLDKSTDRMEEGTEIEYKLTLRGIPLTWNSVIEQWQPQKAFVDRQTKGPYRKWIHTHSFEEMAGGVLITDYVRYRLPAGRLGKLIGSPLVQHDLKKIFSYRRDAIAQEFGYGEVREH